MEGNFIVLFRKLTEWEWYTDIPTKTLFLHLLLTANYKPNKWQGQTIKRGELITSVSSLAEQTGLSIQQVRTALNKLKNTDEISVTSTNRFTLVKVHNYGKYQDYEKAEQQTNNKRITNKQQTDNNTITNKQRNKETNILYRDILYSDLSEKLVDALEGFFEMRKKIRKPMTDKAKEMLFNKLKGYSESEQIAMLNESTEKCWLTVYPKGKTERTRSYDIEKAMEKAMTKKIIYEEN